MSILQKSVQNCSLNCVERYGLSAVHPARHLPVGTFWTGIRFFPLFDNLHGWLMMIPNSSITFSWRQWEYVLKDECTQNKVCSVFFFCTTELPTGFGQ